MCFDVPHSLPNSLQHNGDGAPKNERESLPKFSTHSVQYFRMKNLCGLQDYTLLPCYTSNGTQTVGESKLVVHTTFHYGDAELRIFNLSC